MVTKKMLSLLLSKFKSVNDIPFRLLTATNTLVSWQFNSMAFNYSKVNDPWRQTDSINKFVIYYDSRVIDFVWKSKSRYGDQVKFITMPFIMTTPFACNIIRTLYPNTNYQRMQYTVLITAIKFHRKLCFPRSNDFYWKFFYLKN